MYIFYDFSFFRSVFRSITHANIVFEISCQKLILEKPTLKNAPFHRSVQTDIPNKLIRLIRFVKFPASESD